MNVCFPILIMGAAALWGCSAGAQQLSLFEATGNPVNDNPQAVQPDLLARGADASPGFSLRSISRFGDSYVAVIVDATGTALELKWPRAERMTLPGYDGYEVVSMDSGQLTLQYPSGVPCISQESVGVRCKDQQVVLTLATLSPLATERDLPTPTDHADADLVLMGPQPDNVVVGSDDNPAFINPFAGAVMDEQSLSREETGRAARARARAERLQQFQVERIPEDQVPPGMRLVRTPFGDRLVPIRE